LNASRIAQRVALSSILISAVLATAKITIGLRANSTSVVSDGFESASDVFASGLVLFGLIMAAKPADEDHPYGHGRLEILAGLAVGVILAITGTLISERSFVRMFDVQHAPSVFGLWPLAASIVVKSALWLAKRGLGRKVHSSSLVADSWNDAVDVLSGCTAMAALGLTLRDPVRFAAADHVGGVAVGLIVVLLGVQVIRQTTFELMDTMPDEELLRQVRDVAMQVPGAKAVEKCLARKTGLKYHVDLHLEVDPSMTVFESHEIASLVRIEIKEKLDWVADVLIHVEPFGVVTLAGKRRHG
jgi:cation diffusion facilitator family transporter